MQILPVYTGFDPREEVGTHVFNSSVLANTTAPVALISLSKAQLERHLGEHFATGSNDFTTTRFLVPYLQEFSGPALFVDGADMICLGDLAEIMKHYDPMVAVKVVQHDYTTKWPRKYLGSRMESENRDYDRKQWASVMLFSCGHPEWRKFTPEYVATQKKIDLLQLKGVTSIGELPKEWNWLADEEGYYEDAKLVHYTAGIPLFPGHKNVAHAADWHAYHVRVNHAIS